MAFNNNFTIIPDGTSLPSCMRFFIILPCSVSDLASSRRRSPALKWVNPNWFTILAH
uniref:Uck1 n=1 Tax=Arundo donax TaxID=35708 RepID=A0A0A9GPR7_ARUDO